jgi:plastocyanin
MVRLPIAVTAGLVGLASPGRLGPIAITAAHAEPRGIVKGTVVFDGEPPERVAIRRDSDPVCAKIGQLSDDVIVTSGKLKDVLVRIKNGTLPVRAAAPALPPVVIDQKDCTYTPHLVGLVAGQQIAVRNSDGTFHNVHGTIGGKLLWNKPAAPGEPDLSLDTSTRAGDVIDIACDVHPWMHAYAVVQDHPVFAVTGSDGAFELKGLAPGTYTVEAWHPALGARSLTVKLGSGAKATATARFSFQRAAK